MDVKEAYNILNDQSAYDFGRFYGPLDAPLGVGQLYSGVRYSSFNHADQLFDTREGYVYVISHECDLSQDNIRPFNHYTILCPVIKLEDCVRELSNSMGQDRLKTFLRDLGKDVISRVVFFPAIDGGALPYGGIIYLNQLSHIHVDAFRYPNAEYVNSLTVVVN